MPKFGTVSRARLDTCHEDLIGLFEAVVIRFDCSIICGHRDKAEQMAAFNATPRNSKVPWPHSKHNKTPSLAVDAAPYPVDWEDIRRFYFFGGYVMRAAYEFGIPLRFGGDWDSDTEVKDQTFNDLVHFELTI